MKKTHIIFLFICFPFVNYCQELGPVNVSENLSLLLPKAYEVIYDTRDDYDSVGARKYVATMEKVTVVVTTIPDFRGEIDDEDQMNVFFKKFQVLMLLLAKGKLISERMVYIGSLKCKKFEMTTYNTNLLHWTSYIFRLESTTYTLQFIYPDPYEKNSIETEIVKSLSVHLIR